MLPLQNCLQQWRLQEPLPLLALAPKQPGAGGQGWHVTAALLVRTQGGQNGDVCLGRVCGGGRAQGWSKRVPWGWHEGTRLGGRALSTLHAGSPHPRAGAVAGDDVGHDRGTAWFQGSGSIQQY